MNDPRTTLTRLNGLRDEPTGALREFASLFERRRYEGAALCQQGDVADTLWILTNGAVSVVRTTTKGTPVEVALLQPCTLIGIAGLLGVERRAATLKAKGQVEVLEMSSEEALTLIRNPASLVGGTFRRALIAAIAKQVRDSNTNIAKLAVEVGIAERVVSEENLLSAITVF